MKTLTRLGLVAAFAMAAAPAIAHPKLLNASPAAGGTASNVTRAALSFSEQLMPQLSGMDIVMTAMPGMASHAPMPLKGFQTSVEADGKTLVAAFPRPLPAGTYKLDWHAVSVDTHRVTGTMTFTVR